MPIVFDPKTDPVYQEGIEKGIQLGIQQGIQQGLEQGLEQGIKKAIIGMYNVTKDINLISKALGVSKEKILEVIKNR